MRRIDLNKIEPDTNWDTRAQTVQQRVDGGDLQPSKANGIWRDSKARLKKLSHGKCWYCESRQERSDNDVDHFRPKSIYPQFTCDIANFRYSCTFCNCIRNNPQTGESSGKGDHFPLLGGSRASNNRERRTEQYVLIDPCVTADVGLLSFTDDGCPCANYPDQTIRASRAIASIRYYHLDHPDLNEARRELALQIYEWIDGADILYNELDQGDVRAEQGFNRFLESIGRALDKSAAFSVFAKKIVKGHRDKPWVEDLLDCA